MNIQQVQLNNSRLSACRSISCGNIKYVKDLLLMGTAKTPFSFPDQTRLREQSGSVHIYSRTLSQCNYLGVA